MPDTKTIIIIRRMFIAIVSLSAISLFTGCKRDQVAVTPSVANPDSAPNTSRTVSEPQREAPVPQAAPERLWPRTPAGAIPVKTWKTAEAIFLKENLSAGCERHVRASTAAGGDGQSAAVSFQKVEQAVVDLEKATMEKNKGCQIIVEPNGTQEIVLLLQDDIDNQFDLICSRSPEEREVNMFKIKDNYLEKDEMRTEISSILSQKEAQIRRGDTLHSSCKGELYDSEKHMKMVFKDGLIFVKIAEKHSYSSNLKDDETGQPIISEGVTGVIYALAFRNGKFRIAEKLRAPSLLTPEEEEYSPNFF